MEPTQLVIIIATVTISALLLILGIQVFYILREIRISMQKVNKMLEDAGRVSGTIGQSVESLGGFVNGLKAGMQTIATLKGKGDHHD